MDQETSGNPHSHVTSRIQEHSHRVANILLIAIGLYLLAWAAGLLPHPYSEHEVEKAAHAIEVFVPPLWSVLPFVGLLLVIAIFPLIGSLAHWWHSNLNRFLIALGLSFVTLAYYAWLHPGGVEDHFLEGPRSTAGWDTAQQVFSNALFGEYIPFIVLLFSLYVISGGINVRGDLPAHPLVNSAFLLLGALAASFIGTTGAAMIFIRPLLVTNSQRKHKVHTVLFFIFMVCNCGGLLLPIGDPPLFLGYLRGVPFTWTLRLWPFWVGVNLTLLVIYYVWDRIAYSKEPVEQVLLDEIRIRPMHFTGKINLLLILGVVLSVALLVSGKPFLGTSFVPPLFFRETVMLLMVVLSLRMTPPEARFWNRFDYHAILEVAALFFGIFITMQAPIEILHAEGAKLGIDSPFGFFWATGLLSSFLDNAPTYVVFFETAISLPATGGSTVLLLGGRQILESYLIAISLGAVLMGANTYIGNGPNFMVRSIAEQSGIRMPSFFGYMLYSLVILVPIWFVVSLLL